MTMSSRFIPAMDRLLRWVFYPALALIFLRPSLLKFATPFGRVSITSAQSIVFLLGSLWLLAFLVHPRRYFTGGTIEYPLVLFLAANCASAIFSPFGSAMERTEAILEIFLYAAFFYSSLYLLMTAVECRRVALLFFATAVLVATVNIAYHFRQGMWMMIDRGYPFWDGKNALGLFMVLALSLSTSLIVRPDAARGAAECRSGWRTAAFAPGLLAMFLCMVYSYSRGAWIAMAAAALVFCLFRSWRLIALLVAAILALSYLPHGRAFKRFLSIGKMRDRNVTMRFVVWDNAVEIMRAHPFLGAGPGEFRRAYDALAARDELTRKMETQDKNSLRFRNHAHNLFLQVGAESGIVGIIALIWGGIAVCRAVCARRRNSSNPAGDAMVQGIAAALVAFLVFSLVDCSWTGRLSGGSFMHINFTVILFLAMLYAMGTCPEKSHYSRGSCRCRGC